MVIQIVANATLAKLINADRDAKLLVSEALSYVVEGAEYSNKFRSGGWSGISSFFKMTDATFPAGFVGHIKSLLEKKGYTIQVVRRQLPEPLGPVNPVVDSFPEESRYNYQMETVRRLESKGRMVAMLATGAGKSRVAKLAYKRIGRMTLFLTTRSVLMYQMADAFTEMGEKVGIIGDGTLKIKSGMNLGMVQTFMAMLKDPAKSLKTKALLEKFELVILEEAHEISGNGYYEILNLCKNAHYRLALTATPFMKDNGEDNMRLHAAVGGIGIKITEQQLIQRGILAQPYFRFIPAERPKFLFKSTNWRDAYRIGIVENVARNQAIVFEAERAVKFKLETLILVQHKAHGEMLLNMLTGIGVRCAFIYGEKSQNERKLVLDNLKAGKINVVIGSTIVDVGVDVPALGMVILAGGSKAEVALRQRIGRGLRAKKQRGNVTFIVDFCDDGNKHLKKHSIMRRAIIESTPGFAEGILKNGQDFNWSLINGNN